MMLLWLLMILAPIFVIVAIWTKLIQKTWVKIIVTFISAFALIVTLALWTTYNDLEECEESVSYVVDRDETYMDCINDYDEFSDIFDHCILPFTKLISETYK